MSPAPEFSRIVKLDRLPAGEERFAPDAGECASLAARFDLPGIDSLEARLSFNPDGEAVIARGTLHAAFRQRCAVSDEPFPTRIEEPLAFRFVPALAVYSEEDEVEFAEDEPDEIPFEGAAIDVGEAIAQSFGLALDPYATGPDADAARRDGGVVDEDAPRGALADALGALTLKPGG